jgi:hypothetical protein
MVQNFQIHSKSKWSRVIRDSTLRNNSTLTQKHLTYVFVNWPNLKLCEHLVAKVRVPKTSNMDEA